MRTESPDLEHAQLFNALFGAIGRLRRQVGRLAGRAFYEPGLSAAQAEFLRLVGRNPGISVKMAAAELGLAPNSVSTFVTALVRAGLVVRQPDPDDRRIGRLSLAADAQEQADATRRRRSDVVSRAVGELTAAERTELAAGLRVIGKLTDLLQVYEQQRNGET
jgi:DNA-binding MarR family transcriptional regulator